MARGRWPGLLLGLTLPLLLAAAPPSPEAEALVAERDALIGKIVRGVDYEESVRRFVALHRQQERTLMDAETTAAQLQRAREDERRWREAYQRTLDHDVSWRCTLSPDPRSPLPSDEGRPRADWGRVLRKEVVRLPPKNALDEGEAWTLYEVEGQARRYVLRGDRPLGRGRDAPPLAAEVGDLLLICDGGSGTERQLPPSWQGAPLQRGGLAARIAAPPLIVKKAALSPRHITSSRFFWAIREVRWKYEGRVLTSLEVGKDLGGGRYEIPSLQGLSWILEVPPALPRRQLLVPGRSVWAILGQARFDPALRKLILVAEDLEERYVQER